MDKWQELGNFVHKLLERLLRLCTEVQELDSHAQAHARKHHHGATGNGRLIWVEPEVEVQLGINGKGNPNVNEHATQAYIPSHHDFIAVHRFAVNLGYQLDAAVLPALNFRPDQLAVFQLHRGHLKIRTLSSRLLNLYRKFKVRARDSTSPPVGLPASLKILDVRALTQVDCRGRRAGIKLLRKPEEGLRSPVRAIRRTPYGNVQRFLFQDFINLHDQQDGLGCVYTQLKPHTLSRRFYCRTGRHQITNRGICHGRMTHTGIGTPNRIENRIINGARCQDSRMKVTGAVDQVVELESLPLGWMRKWSRNGATAVYWGTSGNRRGEIHAYCRIHRG